MGAAKARGGTPGTVGTSGQDCHVGGFHPYDGELWPWELRFVVVLGADDPTWIFSCNFLIDVSFGWMKVKCWGGGTARLATRLATLLAVLVHRAREGDKAGEKLCKRLAIVVVCHAGSSPVGVTV